MRSLHGSGSVPDLHELNRKRVSFHMIMVQEYPMILGDNPACRKGVPVMMDWIPQHSSNMDLELWEIMREEKRRPRRKLVMSDQKRAKILFSAGYSMKDLVTTSLVVNEIKESRRESLKAQGWDRIAATFDSTTELPAAMMKGVLGKTGGVLSTTGAVLSATGRAITGGAKTVVDASGNVIVQTGSAFVNTGTAVVYTSASVVNNGAQAVVNTSALVVNKSVSAVAAGAGVLSTTGGIIVTKTGGILMTPVRQLGRIVPLKSKSATISPNKSAIISPQAAVIAA